MQTQLAALLQTASRDRKPSTVFARELHAGRQRVPPSGQFKGIL
ncbi:MAG TPA: hypothetical protein VFE24_09900 [Pirellulales bacterium]|jgi:hypothetical protein|nr:hypothetical protein [Pirellulales bacterium]